MPPTLPADVALTSTELAILDMLGSDYGTSTASIVAFYPMTGMRSLTHLELLGQVLAVPTPTPAGPTVMWYLAP